MDLRDDAKNTFASDEHFQNVGTYVGSEERERERKRERERDDLMIKSKRQPKRISVTRFDMERKKTGLGCVSSAAQHLRTKVHTRGMCRTLQGALVTCMRGVEKRAIEKKKKKMDAKYKKKQKKQHISFCRFEIRNIGRNVV